MKVENLQFPLDTLDLAAVRRTATITDASGRKTLKINPSQLKFLELLKQGETLHDIVISHYGKDIPFSYLGWRDLLKFLIESKHISHPEIVAYFSDSSHVPEGFIKNFKSKFLIEREDTIDIQRQLRHLPFFRALEAPVYEAFAKHAQVVDAPSNITLCRRGTNQRSLIVLLRGSVSVIGEDALGGRKKLASLGPGSVFGEIGFFLDNPRTADVVTDTDCVVVKINYVDEAFASYFNLENAHELTQRLRFISAVLKSEVFGHIPHDCFDALVRAIRMVTYRQNHVICREDDSGDSCYIIVEGRASVSRKDAFIRSLGPGDCFGEMALLNRTKKRSATIRAETELRAAEITSSAFYQLMANNFFLACEFEKIAHARTQDDLTRKSRTPMSR